jgi:hypothetical protein
VERTVKNGHDSRPVLISPAAQGWRVVYPGEEEVQLVATLQQAAETILNGHAVHLALPYSSVVFERLTLPATDSTELGGMVRLQLEKTLPYPPEEITADYSIIEQREGESVVLGIGASSTHLESLCSPLREKQLLPSKITVFALQVAARCPKDRTVLLIYREEGKLILAVCVNGRLAYTQMFNDEAADVVVAELPQFVLSAELEGAPTHFSSIFLDRACADLLSRVGNFFSLSVEMISLDDVLPDGGANLLPDSWQRAQKKLERTAQTRSRLVLAAIIYGALILSAIGYLVFLSFRLGHLERQLATLAPQVKEVQSRQARWNALAPAIDPSRYTVEILNQIDKSLPEGIRITTFDQTKDQFMIEGEAPSANLAVDFIDRLKKNPDLGAFKFEGGAPSILPNEHAQFRVFGKL